MGISICKCMIMICINTMLDINIYFEKKNDFARLILSNLTPHPDYTKSSSWAHVELKITHMTSGRFHHVLFQLQIGYQFKYKYVFRTIMNRFFLNHTYIICSTISKSQLSRITLKNPQTVCYTVSWMTVTLKQLI